MPASIGIAGETASGKSTITLDIIDTIELFANVFNLGRVITRVNTDDYYYCYKADKQSHLFLFQSFFKYVVCL